MNNELQYLQEINPLVAKVVDGNNLTSEETKKAFTTIFLHDTEGYHLAVLLAALHAKGETADELLGLISTYRELATPLEITVNKDKITDLSGTGGGRFKTINVSTAASFVVAAAGYTVGKAAYYGITSPTGSADIFSAFGIDITKLKKEEIEEALMEVGIAPFFVPFFSPKLANRGKISRKLFGERKLQIRTAFHLTTNVFSPFPITHRIYGCYSEKYLEVLAQLFIKLGFKRTLTFFAEIGIPEISNVGKTIVVEQNGNKIKRYILTSEELGVKEQTKEAIQSGGKEQNIKDFLSIIKGSKGAKSDLVAINAGAALYALKDTKSIKEGVIKAKEILMSGECFFILKKLINKLAQ